jgi:hypothetical protein
MAGQIDWSTIILVRCEARFPVKKPDILERRTSVSSDCIERLDIDRAHNLKMLDSVSFQRGTRNCILDFLCESALKDPYAKSRMTGFHDMMQDIDD